MTLLHIDSSILGEQSASRQLSAAIVARLTRHDPACAVVYRDLAADPPPHLAGCHLAGHDDPAVLAEIRRGEHLLQEFLAADTVVLGVALYNLSIPSQLKAWIDRIVVAGRTFRYTEAGPQGLARGKRVILAVARGGHYCGDAGLAPGEHAEAYLRSVFAFIGIPDPEVIAADGLSISAGHRTAGIRQALDAITALPCR